MEFVASISPISTFTPFSIMNKRGLLRVAEVATLTLVACGMKAVLSVIRTPLVVRAKADLPRRPSAVATLVARPPALDAANTLLLEASAPTSPNPTTSTISAQPHRQEMHIANNEMTNTGLGVVLILISCTGYE
jgi:hypothetical protein